jgi:cellulose synthase/poly-beta-1,6-N-acetylglucosamine synthase-like glycosyltransferase
MTDLFLLFPAIIISLHVFVILSFITGWSKIPIYPGSSNPPGILISVIIPFRDESKTLPHLLDSLNRQEYPREHWEVIFVDDHSTDNGDKIIQDHPLTMEFNIIKNQPGKTGKKAAIKRGISNSKGELIVQTDCDCLHDPRWLATLAGFYREKSPDLIIGPVIIKGNTTFFQKFQELEFASLLASTAGSTGIDHPLMCNGANIAFTPVAYKKSRNAISEIITSGDDVFLLHGLKKNQGSKICFLKSPRALVTTSPSPTPGTFIEQRKRWASKSVYYQDTSTISVAIIVLMTNLMLLASFLYLFFNFASWWIFTALFILKSIPDFILLKKVTAFFGLQKATRYFIPVQFLYFFYVSFTAFLSFFKEYSWKGRKVKK